jgi:hypothetical protein
MGFLDNLENTLKNLEGRDERAAQENQQRREAERAHSRAIAAHADALKKSPFVNEFLSHAVRLGYATRTKVNPIWLGSTLRVEAREKRLEFRPTPDGIRAVYYLKGEEAGSEAVNLGGDAEALAKRWLDAS